MIEAVLLFILKAIGFTLLFLLKLLGLILLIFLVVLIIVLVTPIKIGITYQELLVYVKWNGIKYQIYPMKERKKSGFFRKKQAKKEEDLPKEIQTQLLLLT